MIERPCSSTGLDFPEKRQQYFPMSDFRCYTPDLDSQATSTDLSRFESHHLVGTNRARSGDPVTLFNGRGTEWDAVLVTADRRQAGLSVTGSRTMARPVRTITLAIALVKGKPFDTVLREATAMGVFVIQPLETQRTQVQIKDFSDRRQKWQLRLVEACKQSGNPWLPELKLPTSLKQFLESVPRPCGAVASLEKPTQPWKGLSPASSQTLFVGPEGDFTDEEYHCLREKGMVPLSLGPYVLRSETAVIAGLSRMMQTME